MPTEKWDYRMWRNRAVVFTEGHIICEVNKVSNPNFRENTRLIANAPKLLESLRNIQEMTAEAIRTGKAEGTILYRIEADARAAISAVTGKREQE